MTKYCDIEIDLKESDIDEKINTIVEICDEMDILNERIRIADFPDSDEGLNMRVFDDIYTETNEQQTIIFYEGESVIILTHKIWPLLLSNEVFEYVFEALDALYQSKK